MSAPLAPVPGPSAHAILSASGAKRWLNCTPSARLEASLPEVSSPYADEGTLAHAIAELRLRKQYTAPMGPKKYQEALSKLQENPLYQPEMMGYIDSYMDHIAEIVHSYTSPPYITLERRLDYSAYVPEGFGTGDCIIIGGDTLHINDLKYGKGVPVSAEDNPQMRLYALGALHEYGMFYAPARIRMTIVQPRLDSISTDELTVEELLQWGEGIKDKAWAAWTGAGDFVPGDWCQFCKLKATCRARVESCMELEGFTKILPTQITPEEVGNILERVKRMEKWAKDLQAYTLSACLRGMEIPGWKAVHGRGSRSFSDLDAAFAKIEAAGTPKDMLYVRAPLTAPAVETLLGKKQFKLLVGDLVVKSPGKPTLAPASDDREPVAIGTTANDDFAEIESEEY